jgi:hypothetical protein
MHLDWGSHTATVTIEENDSLDLSALIECLPFDIRIQDESFGYEYGSICGTQEAYSAEVEGEWGVVLTLRGLEEEEVSEFLLELEGSVVSFCGSERQIVVSFRSLLEDHEIHLREDGKVDLVVKLRVVGD